MKVIVRQIEEFAKNGHWVVRQIPYRSKHYNKLALNQG